eukprot:7010789-Pyramimonas_sp.AAC.1
MMAWSLSFHSAMAGASCRISRAASVSRRKWGLRETKARSIVVAVEVEREKWVGRSVEISVIWPAKRALQKAS